MSEETKEITETNEPETNEVVDEKEEKLPVAAEDDEAYEVTEVIEELVASGQSSAYLKNEYIYEFELRGQKVVGLTASAYAYLALVENVSIEEMIVTGGKLGYTADATAVKLDTNQRAFGTGFAYYKDSSDKLDRFARQKAMTVARRNAQKQLLPFEKVAGAVALLSDVENILPPSQPQQTLPSSPRTDTENREMKNKEMFAVWNERETDLLNQYGINKYTFWAGVKVKCSVLSRSAMTANQMSMIINALRSETFPKWVTDLQFPNVKVKLFALCEERKKDLPDDIWEQFSEKTGVKLMTRLTLSQAKMCYEFVCQKLGILPNADDEQPISAESNIDENGDENGDEDPIPF